MNNVTIDDPQFSDVRDLKDGFQAWRHTYKYRGIKYDIAYLWRIEARWFVVERHDDMQDICGFIDSIGMRHDFLYHSCEDDTAKRMFYDAVDRAKEDIDWLINDSLTDAAIRIMCAKDIYSKLHDIIDENIHQLRMELLEAFE